MNIRQLIRQVLFTSSLLLPALLFGQAPTGELHIDVKDPSGAAVLRAAGSLQDLATGFHRLFETDASGSYTEKLPPGRYRLEISKEGFATESSLVEVQSGASLSRSITLALGTATVTVTVVATTPLVGSELSLREIPTPVQAATQQDLKNSGALELSDFLNHRLSGVNINENQENPFQPDLNYRGYTASPLLGTPEGISVYMDGVRLNQPFGDVVNWDLIPRIAITSTPAAGPARSMESMSSTGSIRPLVLHSAPRTS